MFVELFRERAVIDTPLALDLISLAARAPAAGLSAVTFRLVLGRVRSEEVRALLDVLVGDEVITRRGYALFAGPRLGELTTYAPPTPALRRQVRSLMPLLAAPAAAQRLALLAYIADDPLAHDREIGLGDYVKRYVKIAQAPLSMAQAASDFQLIRALSS